MKLALVTQYYPPETGAPQARLSDLARRLAYMGHDIQILTALPNYPGTAIYPAYKQRANQTEADEGVRVSRVSLYVPARRTFARRMANYLTFAWNVRRFGHKLLEPCDVLMMETPPLFLGLGAVRLARQLGAHFVVNVSDLWPRSAVEMGIVKPGLALSASKHLEAWLYRSAALVTGQTEGILDDIHDRFPDVRVRLFPNGVDCQMFSPTVDGAALRREFGWSEGTIVVGYTGILGLAQGLDQVLDAAALLAGCAEVKFALIGDGPEKLRLEEAIATRGLSNVRIYPAQPWSRMPAIQAAIDVGIVPLANRKVFEGARPSKMFEVMASARPLLLCAKGESVRVMNSAPGGPAGLAVPPESPSELAAAVKRLAADQRLRLELGQRGRALVVEQYDREAIARHVASYLEELK